jgi:type III restriction enzyme
LNGEVSDEAMRRLLAVEHDVDTEIVIHVNKLKEGWDVTNLYTIVPLRASASEILTEQTIGRGLRLPYGRRTGVEAVDRLTIIAHDRFQEILDRAKDEESIIRKTTYIGGDDESDVPDKKPKLIETPSILDMLMTGKQVTQDGTAVQYPQEGLQFNAVLKTEQQRKIAEATLQVINEETRKYASSEDLSQPEIQKMIVRKVQRRIQPIQSGLPGIELTSGGDAIVAEVVKTVSEKIPLSLLYAVSDKLSQAC